MRHELVERMKRDFQDEEARYAYVEDFMNSHIAIQIKGVRKFRQLSQEQLAKRFGTQQSGISRLENVNYSSWEVETLRKVARALGVRLRISGTGPWHGESASRSPSVPPETGIRVSPAW